jgi:hypothetical protein
VDIHAESEFFVADFREKPVVLFPKGPKTISMMNEHSGDCERMVTFANGCWRRGELSGPVAASMPIRRHRQFCELAVLASPQSRTLGYAARVVHTERWLFFNRLHSWMYPIVEELLGIQEKYRRLVERIAEAHRLTQ